MSRVLEREGRVAESSAWIPVSHHLPPLGVEVEVDLGDSRCRAAIRQEAEEWVWVFDAGRGPPRLPIYGSSRLPGLRVRRWRVPGERPDSGLSELI